jgi:hypothetical protein
VKPTNPITEVVGFQPNDLFTNRIANNAPVAHLSDMSYRPLSIHLELDDHSGQLAAGHRPTASDRARIFLPWKALFPG